VPDFADLVVDLYLPDDTAAAKSPVTFHPASWQVNYVSRPGNHAGAVTFPVAATTAYRRSDGLPSASSFFLSRVEVEAPQASGLLVAFGDSITDGHAATTNGDDRWPDVLAARLQANASTRNMAVVNVGIGGNHLLTDGLGPNALARMDRDVFARPGAKAVILLEAINDLGKLSREDVRTPEMHKALVADLIAAYRQMILRAHAQGVRVIGCTITPYVGSDYYHPDAASEADRQALNAWIRTSGMFDAVVDLDKAIRDPAHPDRMVPAYDSGDHLHPSVAGYKVMGEAINLEVLR